MTRACKHENAIWIPLGDLTDWSKRAMECQSCGAWLSLGPSSESPPRVALELRALEILDAHATQRHDLLTNDEHYGWNLHQLGYDIDADVPAIWAGWLAREIWVHGDNNKEQP